MNISRIARIVSDILAVILAVAAVIDEKKIPRRSTDDSKE